MELAKREILLIKLSNNMDVIGEVKERVDATSVGGHKAIRFKRIFTLLYQAGGAPGLFAVGIQPYMIAADEAEMPIREDFIMTELPAPQKLADMYRDAVSPIKVTGNMPVVAGRRTQ